MAETQKTLSPKVAYSIELIDTLTTNGHYLSPEELFIKETKGCKEKGIQNVKSMSSSLAYARTKGLIKSQKQERNGKLVTCYTSVKNQ